MLTLLDYLDQKGWEGKQSGNGWMGRCPIHSERKPSFKIYGDGEQAWWECFHEGRRTGDIYTMINILEFEDTDTKKIWHQVFQRYKALGGQVEDRPLIMARREKPGATEAQRAMMTEAMRYWHEQLWQRTFPAGRSYLQARGVSLSDIRPYQQLGYAPPTTRQVIDEFTFRMQRAVGSQWKETAKELGLLSAKTDRLGIWDRVMFCSVDDTNACVYYQGRRIQRIDQERLPFAHMGTKQVRKYPFSLPVPRPSQDFFTYTESAFGSVILATHGLPAVASQGSPSADLLQFMKRSGVRHIIATDADQEHHYHDGRPYFPGESHAKKLVKLLEEQQRLWKRVAPPIQYKDLDTWIREEKSIDPFLRAVG